MNFRTELHAKQEPHGLIDYHSKIVLLGSCFAENIGKKLDYFQFQYLENPFGVLFHPSALEKVVVESINDKNYQTEDLIQNQGIWNSFDAHSRLSSPDQDITMSNLNEAIAKLKDALVNASHLVISLGSAWVYRHMASNRLVANCHKIPQKEFIKELSDVSSVTESLEGIIQLVKSVNKDLRIIFTVSPVRHLRDGFVENNQSKAHLLAAVHQVVDPRHKVHYFPSYEYMMDDLRDYRYYAEDMVHPNELAISYIWDKFVDTWLDSTTEPTMNEVEGIQKGIEHKPFHSDSDEHQAFLNKLNLKKERLIQEFPHMHF